MNKEEKYLKDKREDSMQKRYRRMKTPRDMCTLRRVTKKKRKTVRGGKLIRYPKSDARID